MHDLGTTLGGYEILRQLATDGVTTTYEARRSSSNGDAPSGVLRERRVALQVSGPLAETSGDNERAEQFKRDAIAASEVDHPAIAKVVDVGRDGDRVFVAAEWNDAVTLDDLIAERWQLASDDVTALMSDLASALDVLHARGIVHGALSPRTIWVERRDSGPETAFLYGFGTAALVASRLRAGRNVDDPALLEAGLYTAPEQLRGEQFGGRADQYALACAIYHCLTGEPPFVRDGLPALIGAHLLARPSKLPAGTDPALRRALRVGMAKQPDDRYPSCSHLLRAARAPATAKTPPHVVALASATPAEEPPPGQRADSRSAAASWWKADRRPAWLMPAFALLAGAAVVLIGVNLLTQEDASGGAEANAASQADVAGNVEPAADQADGTARNADSVADGDADRQDVVAPDVVWRADVEGGDVRTLLPIGDTTVVTTDAGLYGLDAESGDISWEHPVAGRDVSGVTRVGDVVVYRSVGVLEGLDVADGEELWARSDRYTPDGNMAAAPRTLYGVGPGRVLPEIIAIDPTTGRERWHFHGEDVDVSSSAGIAATADIVTIAQDGALIAFDPAGELGPSGADRREIEQALWVVDLPKVREESVRQVGDQVLLATADGRLCSHRLDDGRQSWCRPVDGADGSITPVLLPVGTDAVTVVTETITATYELASGDLRWQVDADGGNTGTVTQMDDLVVVAERSGPVVALSLDDGAERWRVRAGGPVVALSATDRVLYAGTDAGRVLRFES